MRCSSKKVIGKHQCRKIISEKLAQLKTVSELLEKATMTKNKLFKEKLSAMLKIIRHLRHFHLNFEISEITFEQIVWSDEVKFCVFCLSVIGMN